MPKPNGSFTMSTMCLRTPKRTTIESRRMHTLLSSQEGNIGLTFKPKQLRICLIFLTELHLWRLRDLNGWGRDNRICIENPSKTIMVKGLAEHLSFCHLTRAFSWWGCLNSIAMDSLPSNAYLEFKAIYSFNSITDAFIVFYMVWSWLYQTPKSCMYMSGQRYKAWHTIFMHVKHKQIRRTIVWINICMHANCWIHNRIHHSDWWCKINLFLQYTCFVTSVGYYFKHAYQITCLNCIKPQV